MAYDGITLADAIVSEVNAAGVGTFGETFTAVREWFDETDTATTGLTVKVIPDESREERVTKGAGGMWRVEFDVLIVVQKEITANTNADADAVNALLSKLRDYYKSHEVSGQHAGLMRVAMQSPKRSFIKNHRRAYGFVRLTFLGHRTPTV